jgi:type II secretory pathway pseudopilin PulG
VELLVVIAILCMLFALLYPVITGVRNAAMRVVCANNLQQVAIVVNSYAVDHKGTIPPGNSQAIGSLKYWQGRRLDNYMKPLNIPPVIWYCPSLAKMDCDRQPWCWMSKKTSQAKYGAFTIGYHYVGNITTNSKFRKPIPKRIYGGDAQCELVFDMCKAWRPAPDNGGDVTSWKSFPHYGINNPNGAQVLMGDLHIQYRTVSELSVGIVYTSAPVNGYW